MTLQFRLVLRIVLRMTAWGALGGAGLGSIYGLLLFLLGGNKSLSLVGAIVGFTLGGLLGTILGSLDGLVLAATLHNVQSQVTPVSDTGITGCILSVIVTTAGSLLMLSSFTSSLNVTDMGWTVYTILPTILAAILTWKASREVTMWTKNNMLKNR